MKIERAKEYFDLGILTDALVRAPYVLHKGWTVEVSGNTGNASPSIETVRGQVREWSSLDSAARAVRAIGFRSFRVITD